MAQQRRLVNVLIASMPVFLALRAWSATTPVIESAVVDNATNQMTDYDPRQSSLNTGVIRRSQGCGDVTRGFVSRFISS